MPLLLLLLASGCAPSLDPAEQDDQPRSVTIGYTGGRRVVSEVVSALTTEGLVQTNPDGSHDSLLATSWRTTDHQDGTRTVSFALQEGVRFHDGSPLDADEVTRFVNDARANRARRAGYPSLVDIDRVEAVGTAKMEIGLRQASGFLLDALTLGIYVQDEQGTRLGTGPFMEAERSDSHVTLVANPTYHKGPPLVDAVKLVPYQSLRTAWAAMLRGEVDVLHEVPIAARDFVDEETDVNLVPVVRPYAFLLGFNRQRPLFDDVRIRRALNHAVDRQAIVDTALDGYGRPASGVWALHRSYDGVERTYEYDPQQAARLLDDAGLTRSDAESTADTPTSRLTFTCLVPASIPLAERIAIVVQRQLNEVGIAMELVMLEGGVGPDALKTTGLTWDAALVYQPTGQSLSRLYSLWHSSEVFNGFGYAAADEVLDTLRRAEPGPEQDAPARAFQQLIYDDPPAVFLVEREQARAISTRFRVPAVTRGQDVIETIREWDTVER